MIVEPRSTGILLLLSEYASVVVVGAVKGRRGSSSWCGCVLQQSGKKGGDVTEREWVSEWEACDVGRSGAESQSASSKAAAVFVYVATVWCVCVCVCLYVDYYQLFIVCVSNSIGAICGEMNTHNTL